MKKFLWGLLVLASLDAFSQNYLTVYSYPPSSLLNWKTPSTLMGTMLGNIRDSLFSGALTKKSASGHAASEIECRDRKGRVVHFWSGMSGQNSLSEDWKNVMVRQIGMGVLFKTYRDGRIQGESEEKIHVINYRGGRNNEPRFIRFEISSEQCEFLAGMHKEYERRSYRDQMPLNEWVKRPDSKVLLYGLEVENPLKNYLKFLEGSKNEKLGGGCTGYATSLIRAAGHWSSLFEKIWKREFIVSEKLIGVPGFPVSLRQLLDTHNWIFPQVKNKKGWVFDPEFIWKFISQAIGCLSSSKDCPKDVASWINQRGHRVQNSSIKLDSIQSRAVQEGSPDHPVWVYRDFKVSRELQGITVRGLASYSGLNDSLETQESF